MNRQPIAKIAQNLGRRKRGDSFIELGRREGLNLKIGETQEIWPQKADFGSPFPLVACSFGGVLANPLINLHEAGIRFANKYLDGASMVPSLSEFNRVYDFDEGNSVLYDLGIPRVIPFMRVWESYLEILGEVEAENPTRLHPCVPEYLQEIIRRRFHLVIVTSNRTHDIAEIIRSQAGIEKGFDVVIVPSRNKGLVLSALAEYHHLHHGSVKIHFPFFCGSAEDAASAWECGKWVKTFGVVNENGRADEDRHFQESLKRHGASPITPSQILPAVCGLQLTLF